MNKRIVSLVLFGLLSAQVVSAQKLKFGPEFGTNLIQMSKDDFGKDYQLGWHAGGQISFSFTSYFSLKTGLYWTQKKQQFNSQSSAPVSLFGFEDQIKEIVGENVDLNAYTTIKGRTSQYFIEVPLLFKYSYKNYHAYFGPNFSYGILAKTQTLTYKEIPFLRTVDIKALDPSGQISGFFPAPESSDFSESTSSKNLRLFDVGLKTGIGIDFENVELNLAYLYGFFDYQIENERAKNQNHHYFQLSATYNFTLNIGSREKGRYKLFKK